MPAPPSTMLPCLFDVGAASKIPPYASPPGACRADQSGQIFLAVARELNAHQGGRAMSRSPRFHARSSCSRTILAARFFIVSDGSCRAGAPGHAKKGSASGPRYPPPGSLAAPNNLPRVRSEDLRHIIRAQFFLIVEVTDRMTSVAILNCGARSIIPCRLAIQSKSL